MQVTSSEFCRDSKGERGAKWLRVDAREGLEKREASNDGVEPNGVACDESMRGRSNEE
jgi:hypothetical protein